MMLWRDGKALAPLLQLHPLQRPRHQREHQAPGLHEGVLHLLLRRHVARWALEPGV